MIPRTTALRQGTPHKMVATELNEKQEECEPTVGASCQPGILNLARAEICHNCPDFS